MKRYLLLLISISFMIFSCQEDKVEPKIPFPAHTAYTVEYMLPSYEITVLDNFVKDYYLKWKERYVKKCDDGYYVDFSDENPNYATVSEAMGYGMMIEVYMAGYDKDAQEIFDGMFDYYKAHPSSINPNLMAWRQRSDCTTAEGDDDAASDGDIDVAYALVLADRQWGSDGKINYIEEAKRIINAIMESEINNDSFFVKLGDWPDLSEPQYFYATRSSDFITDHFKTFANVTGDQRWNKVVDECYSLIDYMQNNYSPVTGLLPDFIVNLNDTPQPAQPNFLEGANDGNYDYNACRDPWRLTVDYLLTGDPRAKEALDNINAWITETTGGNPDLVKAGYTLDGQVTNDYQDVAFYGAFAVSAMISGNRDWLDKLFDKLVKADFDNDSYYQNTLKMLYMLTLSGNIWN